MALETTRLLPDWITEDYISDVINKGQKTDLQIKIRDVSTVTVQGDNYFGSLYRVTLECYSSLKSLIVKVQPSGEENSFVAIYGVFRRELEIYHKVLPRLYEVMSDKIGRTEYFSPYSYLSSRPDTIILEDLRPLGYVMVDRKEQLDMDHALQVLTALAKLHAFSYIMGPDSIKQYYDTFYSRESRHMSGELMESIVRSLCRAVSTWEGYEKYAALLWQFSESAVDQFNEAVRAKEGSFCVLNHGDCWTNNILFRYSPDTEKPQDVKLIDFQLARYCSPVIDLMYFFYSSLRLDVWKQQEKLLQHYHGELTRWLSSGGVSTSVYTYQDLRRDMKEKIAFAVTSIAVISALAFVDSGDGPDMEKVLVENKETQTSQYHKAHRTEKYRKHVQIFLPFLEQEGLFHTRP